MRLLHASAGPKRVDAEPQAARDLVHLCDCLPLAILLAAGLLRRCPDWTVRYLVDKLLHGEHRPDAHTEQVRTIFDLSYQTPCLRTLSACSAASAHCRFPTSTRAKRSCSLNPLPSKPERLLNTLVDARLISPCLEDGFYRVHDVSLAYACEVLHENEPHRQSAIGYE